MLKYRVFIAVTLATLAGLVFAGISDLILTSRDNTGAVILSPKNGSGVLTNVLSADYQKVVVPSPLPLQVDKISNAAGTGAVMLTNGVNLNTGGITNAGSIAGATSISSGPNFTAGLQTTKIGLGITIPASYASHFFVSAAWNSSNFSYVFENDETENSYGNTMRIIGGAGSGAGSASSDILRLETNNGTERFSVDGIGAVRATGSFTGTGILSVNSALGFTIDADGSYALFTTAANSAYLLTCLETDNNANGNIALIVSRSNGYCNAEALREISGVNMEIYCGVSSNQVYVSFGHSIATPVNCSWLKIQ
jgi:hypothetical protein